MADPGDFESAFDDQFNAGNPIFGYTSEFIFDSDEGSPLPTIPDNHAADSSHAMPDAPQDCPSPSEALGLTSRSSMSAESPRESMFDSASRKGTASTASTMLTMGDLRLNTGAGLKQSWDAVDGLPRGSGVEGLSMMQDAFEFLNDQTLTQSSLRTPADTPSPFGSGAPTFSPEDSMASPPGEAGLSFRASGEDGFAPFTFRSPGSGILSDATAGSSSLSSGTLCLRQSQPLLSPSPKYEFRGSQEPAALSPEMSGILNTIHPAMNQFGPGGTFFDASHTLAQPLFEHHQYGPGPYKLDVFANNTKSRVETQITITLRLSQLPPGVTKVHLPKHTISKPKFWTKPAAGPAPDTLELHAMLVCTSAMRVPDYRAAALQRAARAAHAAWLDRKKAGQWGPTGGQARRVAGVKSEGDGQETNGQVGGQVRADGEDEQTKTQEGGEVRICENCMGRETKRASRKKSKNPEDEAAWHKDQARRVIVFNTHEIKDWTIQNPPESGSRSFWQMQAPMRIACYCRHHSEKLGFQIIFTLTDHLGRFLAQTFSPTVMITDDHKTTSPNPVTNTALGPQAAMLSPREDVPMPGPPGAGHSLEPSPSLDLQGSRRSSAGSVPVSAVSQQSNYARAISRPASPSLSGGPAKRRRGNKSVTKTPTDLVMTPLDTSFLPPSRVPIPSPASASQIAQAASSLPPTPRAMFTASGEMPLFSAGAATPEPLANGFSSTPQASSNNGQLLLPNLNRAPTANMATPMFGLPAAARTNPASSPVASRPASTGIGGQARTQQAPTQPAIFKVIPGEGPVAGGIEVTLMGQGFVHGMQVLFGDKQAPGTACWSSESLVCLLPPSEMAGMVPVTLKHQNGQSLKLAPHFFRYVDDSEQQLLRTALMILGNKMTGGYEDVADFARRIIKEAGSSYPSPGGEMSGPDGSSNRAMDNFEGHLLKLLELMDLSNSTRKPRLNLRRSTGQTMLHLACKLGLHRFVAGLLARGANPDPRDKGGYTALHMASMNSHTEIVRLLIAHGADPTLRTLSGLTASDLAKSRDVVRLIHHYKQHRRSQSGSSSNSRVTSTVSLKSLRAQVSLSQAVEDTSSDEPRSSEEESSGEYSEPYVSDAVNDSTEGEQTELRIRRGKSAANTPARRRSPSRTQRRGTDATGALGLPSAAMAAIREQVAAQFQQLQQMMGPHLQYLPQLPQFPQFRQFPQFSQLPNFPQMPNMPPLPEYQNAVLQRLATMIGGAKPPGQGEHGTGPPAKEQQNSGGWPYPLPFSSFATNKVSTPPPAYDELFPEQGSGDRQAASLDTKEASAARAAADAVADAKCAALFDMAGAATSAATTADAEEEAVAEVDKAAVDDDSEGTQEIPALLQIGRKDAITREQQATLRRAHAQNLKKLSWDRNLFFIWIPLLVLMVGAMLYRGMPGFVTASTTTVPAAVRDAAALVPEAAGLKQQQRQQPVGAIAEGVVAAGV